MKRTTIAALVGLIVVLSASSPSRAVVITTADGNGADTYVNGEGSYYHYGDTNFGTGTTFTARRSGGDYTRKGYLRFDLSSTPTTGVTSATLTLTINGTTNQSGGDTTVNVWAINDGLLGTDNSSPADGDFIDDEDTHDELWPETVIDWFSAPANAGDTTMDPAGSTLLGTFVVAMNPAAGTAFTFESPELIKMLQADTNDAISLVVQPAAGSDYLYFRTKEHTGGAFSPSLEFDLTDVIWDGGGGTDKTWKGAANWSLDAVPTSAVFNHLATAAPGVVTSVVDQNTSVETLTFEQNEAGGAHTLQIDPGATLTVTGGSSANALLVGNLALDGTNHTTITGGGSLVVNSPSRDFAIGTRVYPSGSLTTTSYTTLDMSGLASLDATINEFRLLNGRIRGEVQVTLAETNTIVADAVVVAASTGSTVGDNFLRLGQTNTIHTNKLVVAGARSTGRLEFNPALSGTPTLEIRGKSGGTSRADLWVADQAGNAGYGSGGSSRAVGHLDLTGGSVDAMLDVVIIGRNGYVASNQPAPATGTLSFDEGTIDANTIIVARTPALPVRDLSGYSVPDEGHTYGTLNMDGGTLLAGSMLLGEVQGHAATGVAPSGDKPLSTRATGTFNLSAGTATVLGQITLGQHTSDGPSEATGIVNFSGGTLTAASIAQGTGDNNISEFNWTGGTLHVGTFGLDLVQDGGRLAPGASPGTTNVLGDYDFNAGVLEIEIQSPGTTPGVDFDFVDVTGTATLDSTLEILLLGGFEPAVGDTFDVLTAADIILGAGFQVENPGGPSGGFVASIVAGAGTETLRLYAVPEPSTAVLLLAGLATLWLTRRGRKRR